MKIYFDSDYSLLIKEAFDPIVLETKRGDRIAICMRDSKFEITILGSEKCFTVDIENGTIKEMSLLKMPNPSASHQAEG